MAQVIDRQGKAQEVNLTLEDYKAALDKGLSLSQYLLNNVDTDVEAYGTPFEQMLVSEGMFFREDRKAGIRPPNLKQLRSVNSDIAMGTLVRPDGSNALTVSGRLLYASALGEMVEAALREDTASYAAVWNRLVAMTQTVDSQRVDWPVINLAGPRASRSKAIAQGALPPAMASISLSDKSARLPVFSIGLEVTHQALEAATLDLVNLIVREQADAERVALIDEAIVKLVNGDTDWGLSALPSTPVASYDSSIVANGVMTHWAWLQILREPWKTLNIDWVICDLKTAYAIENRSGRPVVTQDKGTDGRLDSVMNIANASIPTSVNYFIVDTSVIGANTMVLLDSRKAIKKWLWSGAQYEALEDFVLRRTTAMRWDFSEAYTRIFDTAFRKVTLTTS